MCLVDTRVKNSFYTPHKEYGNPMSNDDIIYTPAVKVFKTDTEAPELMDEKDWFDVDVIICAAPNLWSRRGSGTVIKKIPDDVLLQIHEKRLNIILEVAVWKNVDTIILGAFIHILRRMTCLSSPMQDHMQKCYHRLTFHLRTDLRNFFLRKKGK